MVTKAKVIDDSQTLESMILCMNPAMVAADYTHQSATVQSAQSDVTIIRTPDCLFMTAHSCLYPSQKPQARLVPHLDVPYPSNLESKGSRKVKRSMETTTRAGEK